MEINTKGVLIILATWTALFVGWYIVVTVCRFMVNLRTELRDRYADAQWKPGAWDMLFLPLWMVVELFCLAGAIVTGIMLMVLAYQGAKATRDWWHAGGRER